MFAVDDSLGILFDMQKELKSNGYERTIVSISETSTDYGIGDAVVKYREYLSGESKFAHLKKNVSQDHIDECVRFCWKLVENVALTKNKLSAGDFSENADNEVEDYALNIVALVFPFARKRKPLWFCRLVPMHPGF
jgi:hypothetical protein